MAQLMPPILDPGNFSLAAPSQTLLEPTNVDAQSPGNINWPTGYQVGENIGQGLMVGLSNLLRRPGAQAAFLQMVNRQTEDRRRSKAAQEIQGATAIIAEALKSGDPKMVSKMLADLASGAKGWEPETVLALQRQQVAMGEKIGDTQETQKGMELLDAAGIDSETLRVVKALAPTMGIRDAVSVANLLPKKSAVDLKFQSLPDDTKKAVMNVFARTQIPIEMLMAGYSGKDPTITQMIAEEMSATREVKEHPAWVHLGQEVNQGLVGVPGMDRSKSPFDPVNADLVKPVAAAIEGRRLAEEARKEGREDRAVDAQRRANILMGLAVQRAGREDIRFGELDSTERKAITGPALSYSIAKDLHDKYVKIAPNGVASPAVKAAVTAVQSAPGISFRQFLIGQPNLKPDEREFLSSWMFYRSRFKELSGIGRFSVMEYNSVLAALGSPLEGPQFMANLKTRLEATAREYQSAGMTGVAAHKRSKVPKLTEMDAQIKNDLAEINAIYGDNGQAIGNVALDPKPGKIKVRDLSSGRIGDIDPKEYDPAKYRRGRVQAGIFIEE